MTSTTLRRMSAPMTNSGTITSIPTRIVQVSAIQPMSGRTSRPGMTHSEATENPVARARGGMASDSAARMPGPMIASAAEITQLMATATTMFGARAKPTDSDRRAPARPWRGSGSARRRRRRSGGWRCARRDEADELERLGDRRGDAARPLVEAELLLVEQRRRATTKPTSDDGEERQVHQIRRSVGTFWTIRQLSANDGAGSSVSTTSSLAPGRLALPAAAHRLVQPQGEQREDDGRDRRTRGTARASRTQ